MLISKDFPFTLTVMSHPGGSITCSQFHLDQNSLILYNHLKSEKSCPLFINHIAAASSTIRCAISTRYCMKGYPIKAIILFFTYEGADEGLGKGWHILCRFIYPRLFLFLFLFLFIYVHVQPQYLPQLYQIPNHPKRKPKTNKVTNW